MAGISAALPVFYR